MDLGSRRAVLPAAAEAGDLEGCLGRSVAEGSVRAAAEAGRYKHKI